MSRKKRITTTGPKNCGSCKWYEPNRPEFKRSPFVGHLYRCEYDGRGSPEAEEDIPYIVGRARRRMEWEGGTKCGVFKPREGGE